MRIISVTTYNIRNLENQTVKTDNVLITLVGNNGQGKTNFLETIYSICYGNSFRKATLNQIKTFNQKEAFIKASILLDSNEKIEIKYVIQDGKRYIYLQNKEIKDRKELIYTVPCIVFNHEDIDFVQGSPEDKRKFYNQTLTLYDPIFLDDIRKYKNLLKQRNMLLRKESYDLIHIYDYQLAVVGMEIQKKREILINEFNLLFPELFSKITQENEEVFTAYRPSWKNCSCAEEAEKKLKESLDADKRYQTTTTGPHRDRFYIVKNKRNYIETASTGQKRLVSLILRSAQAAFYTKKTGTKPILLLDDVLLELDIDKRARFLQNTTGYSQAFFTFLPGEFYFKDGTFEGLVYKVEEGKIES